MSGHSKWKNTKRRKAVQDAKRGKIISKLVREARTAVKLGGKDMVYNARLRMIFEKALSNNMTKDTFNRAVLSGDNVMLVSNKKNIEDILYEGYGPEGTAVMLKCLTDNKKRTVSEIRYALSKFGGHLATSGSVAYLFNRIGIVSCPSIFSEDIVIDLALKAGADDIVINENGTIQIYISLELLANMRLILESVNLVGISSQVSFIPYKYVSLTKISSLKMSNLVQVLEDIDSIYEIHHNAMFLAS